MSFNVPVVSNLLFYPMKKKANYIYKSADEIIAVSETYLNRALEVNDKVQEGNIVYIGTNLSTFDEAFLKYRYKNKPKDEVWIAYVGTLGHSYDLRCVFDALYILKNKSINNLKFIVMGDGPLKEVFEEYSKEKNINVAFTGRLPYEKMVGILGVCDIAVNPISKGSAGSIINKHADYSAASLPVINTQESKEYRKLVDKYKIGLNCHNNDSIDLAKKLQLILNNSELKENMSKNSRRLAQEKFDRNLTYKSIYEIIISK